MLGIEYFSSIHIAVVVIAIGIGADDVFVFHDCWLHANKHKKIMQHDLFKVLTMTVRTSTCAMFVTSLTSFLAFLACSFCSIMPIKAFGVFSSILVPVMFFLTVLTLPFVYFINEKALVPLRVRAWQRIKSRIGYVEPMMKD